MKVLNIIHDSIVDGEGLRTVVFFSGCEHKCKGCHNPSAWNENRGIDMTLSDLIDEIKSNPLTNVTLSGGDPFFQAKEVKELAKELKKIGKNVWAYTGYTVEEILESGNEDFIDLLSSIDTLVDGKFILEQRDLTLKYRGSSNQRIINVKEYLSSPIAV